MQAQTLLDAHGQEWQLGQVVPKEIQHLNNYQRRKAQATGPYVAQ
jgi:hypothetical protein